MPTAAVGNPVIRAPNLDRLAGRSLVFHRAYSPSPVRVSARCSMHYGQYPHRTGCYDNGQPMPDDRPSFVDLLTGAGYHTQAIGKVHFSPDDQAKRGFAARLRQEEVIEGPDKDDYLQYLFDHGYRYVCDPHGARGGILQTSQRRVGRHEGILGDPLGRVAITRAGQRSGEDGVLVFPHELGEGIMISRLRLSHPLRVWMP